jgi:hypothetical protein
VFAGRVTNDTSGQHHRDPRKKGIFDGEHDGSIRIAESATPAFEHNAITGIRKSKEFSKKSARNSEKSRITG